MRGGDAAFPPILPMIEATGWAPLDTGQGACVHHGEDLPHGLAWFDACRDRSLGVLPGD